MQKLSTKEIMGMILVAMLFLGASYGSEKFAIMLESVVGTGTIWSMLLYVLFIIGIVLTPLASTLPLVPVAVAVWGNLLAAGLTLLGWALSSNLAIRIARKYGRKYLKRVLPFKVIRHFADMVPRSNLVGGITVLAMLGAPIDIISYAIGLFTGLNVWVHTLALTLGAIPFIFFLTYTATLPIIYQTYIVGFMIITWFVAYSRLKYRAASNKNESEHEVPSKNHDRGHAGRRPIQ